MMGFYITLVSASVPLTELHFEKAANFLKADVREVMWLSSQKAGDMPIEKEISIKEVQGLRTLLDSEKIDVFCTPVEGRRKKLFLADMDSTIVTSETLDELADEAGIKDKVSEITSRAMRGELDFFQAIRERVGLLKGLSTDALKRTLENTEISKGADSVLKTIRRQDVFCVLVSGGFTYFTQDVAESLGFHANHGNILDIEGDQLTGEVIDPILDKNTKLELLHEYVNEKGVVLSEAVAIGDGANDLPMLEVAGLGIGYHPKPLLEERLINCIRHTDLTSILYVQGYKEGEFVS